MSQQQQEVAVYGHSTQLPSQSEQLWKIIEKQRVMIQNLQKDNAILAAERDGLRDRVNHLEQRLFNKDALIPPERTKEIMDVEEGPTLPPRSPYRNNAPHEDGRASPSILERRPSTPASPPPSTPPPPQTPTSPQAIIEKDAHLYAQYQSSLQKKEQHKRPPPPSPQQQQQQQQQQQHQRGYHGTPSASKSSSALDHRKRQHEYERAASPPILRAPKTSSLSDGALTIPTSTRKKRESMILAESVDDVEEDVDEENENNTLSAKNISSVMVKVIGSNIKTNEKGRELVSFLLSVGKRGDVDFEELWRVEKFYSDFITLDAKIKAQAHVRGKVGKLPDKQLFSTNSRAPSKIDQRKVALEQYLQHIISLPHADISDVCEFLTTNVVERDRYQRTGRKAGYLTKRGKNFGGWKARYFKIKGAALEYYESKEGSYLGAIKLTNAQLGRQAPASGNEDTGVYRHAFLILEQKRSGPNGLVKHILCANSDEERDEWVEALLNNIRVDDNNNQANQRRSKKPEKQRKVSKGEIRAVAAAPIKNMKSDHGADMDKLTSVPAVQAPADDHGLTPSASTDSATSFLSTSMPNIPVTPTFSAGIPPSSPPPPPPPHHATPPRRRSSAGEDEDPVRLRQNMLSPIPGAFRSSEDLLSSSYDGSSEKRVKQKANRVTMWGKKMFSSSNGDMSAPNLTTDSRISSVPSGFRSLLSRSSNDSSERHSEDVDKAKAVFGVPLEEAVRISRVSDNYELPAVVYRCIEYLDAKDAVMEEGLYRLSGSNMVIKRLKQKFNQEGDVNLLASKEDYDVHAIAGLLKMWLRELPTTVLTREHRSEFMHVIDFLDRKDRVNELGRLVSLLPLANYTLLRALTAHLIRVIRHSDINKMTMRNVSIVFSPTLGVPATIFNLFMSEFEYIFWTTEDGDAAPRMLEDDSDEEDQPAETEQPQSVHPPILIQRKPTLRLREEFGRSNRNSVHYMDGAPNAIVSMEKSMDGGTAVFDEDDDDVDDLALLKDPEQVTSDDDDEPPAAFQGLRPMPPKIYTPTTDISK